MSSTSSPTQAPSTLDLSTLWPPLARYCPHTPTDPQAAFLLLLDQQEAFYGGAAGGGKSDALLMAALQFVDVPGYAALILRRTFKQLGLPGAIMARSHEWLRPTDARWNDDQKTWTFPSGATLTFGFCENESDVYRYQGPEFQFVGFDELTQFSEAQYRYLFSRTRRLVDAGVPIRVRSASNPGGIGHAWVKRRFIDRRKPGVVFIPARLADNPHLDQGEYELALAELSPTLRAQLLDGDWGAFEGSAFTVTDDHLVDEFELLNSHERFEACDYGLNGAPWALVPVDYEGNLVFHDMLYVSDLLPSDVCELVLAKRKSEWGVGHPAYADPSIWHRTGARNRWGAPAMLADEFTDHGVSLQPANNDPRAGLVRLRELLELDTEHPFPDWHERRGEMGAPRVFFHRDRCAALVEELRAAPLQPVDKADAGEKIDPVWESRYGHACFAAGTLVATETGERPIEQIKAGDRVWTRDGLREVRAGGQTSVRRVLELPLEDGTLIVATADHPIWIVGRGWTPLAAVRYEDKCLVRVKNDLLTSAPAGRGRRRTGRFLRATTSITGTRILSTTISRILSACRRTSISRLTTAAPRLRVKRPGVGLLNGSVPPRDEQLLAGLIAAPRTRNDSAKTPETSWPLARSSTSSVSTAAQASRRRTRSRASAPTRASRRGGALRDSMMRRAFARRAEPRSASIVTPGTVHALAPVRVVSVPKPAAGNRSVAVYNLTVDGSPEFFANGVLTHNCAMARYAVMTRPAPSTVPRDLRAEMLAEPVLPSVLRAEALRRREEQLNQPSKRAYRHV